jgi:signal transduction histidine kinase
MTPLRISHVYYYAAIVTLCVALTALVGYGLIRQQMLAANDFFLEVESNEMLSRLSELQSGVSAEQVDAAMRQHAEEDSIVFYFDVYGTDGHELFRSHNLKTTKLPVLTVAHAKQNIDLPHFGLMRVAQFPTSVGSLEIAISLQNFSHVNKSFFLVMLVSLPMIAILSVLVGLRLRQSTLKPVRMMQTAASRINASNLSERIPVPRGDSEMAGLALLLNQMFDRLEDSFKQIKRFTADASHELLTPLSVIRLHAERMRNDMALSAGVRQSIDEQIQEVTHLAETLEKLKVLTKADSNVLKLDFKTASTSDFIANFAEDAQLLAEEKEQVFIVVRNDRMEASFDHGWIRQVLFNLLSNSLRFNPPKGTIALHSKCEDGIWAVEVWDDGPGVPSKRIGELFQRFTQINPTAQSRTGSGLGLAICKSVVEMHHGSITARNRADRTGFIVSFVIPLTC